MNIVLLSPAESTDAEQAFHRGDRRYSHLSRTLGVEPGSRVRAGVVDGPTGEIEILRVEKGAIRYRFAESGPPSPGYPISVVVGHPRPLVMRRLLKDLTTLGVSEVHVVAATLTERSYLSSSLWKDDSVQLALFEGAEQGGGTTLPRVRRHDTLGAFLASIDFARQGDERPAERLLLDRDAATVLAPVRLPAVLAVGPERGWTAAEARALGDAGFASRRLHPRTLRTETACVVAAAIVGQAWS